MVALLRDADAGARAGRRGRERVREHFLLPRLLLNELMLLNDLAGNGPADVLHDPVCGLVLDPDANLPTLEDHGLRHNFCSNDCRRQFLIRRLGPGEASPAPTD